MKRPGKKRVIELSFLAIGIALLVAALIWIDLGEVWRRARHVGWMFVPAFGSYMLMCAFSTLAWRQTIDRNGETPSFRTLYVAFWLGRGINDTAPTEAAGEVVKGSMLKGKMDGRDLITSLVLYNFLTGVASIVWGVFGASLALFFLDIPLSFRAIIFGILASVVLTLLLFWWGLRHGLMAKLLAGARKLPFVKFDRPEELREKAEDIDQRLRDFRKTRPRDFWLAIGFLFLARLADAGEVWSLLVGLMPDHPIAWLFLLSIFIQALTLLIMYSVAALIPGQLGILEGGMAILFQMAGFSPAIGFAMELIRRARKIVALGTGLLLGGAQRVSDGSTEEHHA